MISNPYIDLQRDLEQPEGWRPDWAVRLERRIIAGRSTYLSHPEQLDVDNLAELAQLEPLGWNVTIDSPRLNLLRITLWR